MAVRYSINYQGKPRLPGYNARDKRPISSPKCEKKVLVMSHHPYQVSSRCSRGVIMTVGFI